jgi:mannose/fructose/N-acetylgalactosamine-specific phosphotransferase system component IIB
MNRIDDRLVHGQVMTGWLGLRRANTIWIVDDVVATTPMMLDIFRFAAPAGVKMEAMTVEAAAKRLANLASGNDKVILIAKLPKTFVRLLEGGYRPSDVNYGAMAHKPQSQNVAQNCELSPEEIADTEQLYQQGIRVWIQLVPFGGHKATEWQGVRHKLGLQ